MWDASESSFAFVTGAAEFIVVVVVVVIKNGKAGTTGIVVIACSVLPEWVSYVTDFIPVTIVIFRFSSALPAENGRTGSGDDAIILVACCHSIVTKEVGADISTPGRIYPLSSVFTTVVESGDYAISTDLGHEMVCCRAVSSFVDSCYEVGGG